jgi:hypothetical protein
MTKECRHILTNGSKCHTVALRDKPYCHHHMNVHRLMAAVRIPSKAKEKTFEFYFPDSRASIQLALFQVVNAIGSSQVSPKRAGSLLYSLQIASQNVDRDSEVVPLETIHCITLAEDGDEYGPECESNGPYGCGRCAELGNCPVTAVPESACSAEKADKPLPSIQKMFKDALLQSLSGLSRERFEIYQDMRAKQKEPKSEFPMLSSLLKS